MSEVQALKAFVLQRLTAAAEDIFEQFETTIATYEEKLCGHQKLLDAVLKPEVRLQRAEITAAKIAERRRKTPEQDAMDHIILCRDKPFLEARFINTYKGRGVFTREYIAASAFVVEYRGILSTSQGRDNTTNHFLFDFMWNGTHYCIDASKEDGTLGRLANDDQKNPNCKVEKVIVKGRPHLCLFAVKEIFPGEEITYSYEDSSWPWRSMAPCTESSNPEPKKGVPISSDNEMSWHKSCFLKNNTSQLKYREGDQIPETVPMSDGSTSDEDYTPDTAPSSDCDERTSTINKTEPTVSESSKKTKTVRQPVIFVQQNGSAASSADTFSTDHLQPYGAPCSDQDPTTSNIQWLPSLPRTVTESHSDSDEEAVIETLPNLENSSCTQKNYCFVCNKPQSKIARHLFKHKKEEPDVAKAFFLPKHSTERKRLLEKLRNKGNYQHNQEAMENQSGPLKLKRRPRRSNISLNAKAYVHCVYCKGMFVRKELWRHLRRCPSKTVTDTEATGMAEVSALPDVTESTFFQAVSPGVWKILGNMKQDEVASVVKNDFFILQLGQALYNKHGSDPTKSEYIRQKVREMGRLLLSLRQKFSLFSIEDAVKQYKFYEVIEAVGDVAGYDGEKHSYRTPSLVLKLGHSLKKIGDIILRRAIAAEDEEMVKAAEQFTKLCAKEWTEHFSALATLSKPKLSKPSTIPFTQDVQLFHQYLEKKSVDAIENLKKYKSPQTYAELARVTLVQIILFNRHCAGEVSKMTLESFKKRDQMKLHKDIAVGLSPFERTLAKHFSRVELMGKRGKVALLLTPEIVNAATLLAEKRDTCDVNRDNPFLFGRPQCPSTSFYKGQNCIRIFASQCGAKNPEYLRSTRLRKHVATLIQILSLKNNELDQLAHFLGHDICVHRDFYRLPEATIEMAKISKLLLGMGKGSLARFQGKTLDEIEIEDELEPDLEEGEVDEDDELDEDSDPVPGLRDVQPLLVSKEEVPLEQELKPSLDQDDPPAMPDIKEEQEELWTNQEGEHLQGLKDESDVTNFILIPLLLKSEEYEENEEKHQSSHFHHAEEMKTEANGEDCGEPDGDFITDTHLEPDTDDKMSHFSEPKNDDYCGRQESREPSSGLNLLRKDEEPEAKSFGHKRQLRKHSGVQTGLKLFNCSVCGKKYKYKTALTTHMRLHSEGKGFSCSDCEKNFLFKSQFVRHMRIHAKQKPLSRAVSGKGF